MTGRVGTHVWWAAALLVLLLLLAVRGAGQGLGDAEAGHRLAVSWCRGCHSVEPGETRAVSNGAPSFLAVARMPATTALSLHLFFQSPHQRMPDFNLGAGEMDDLTAYILSLK